MFILCLTYSAPNVKERFIFKPQDSFRSLGATYGGLYKERLSFPEDGTAILLLFHRHCTTQGNME